MLSAENDAAGAHCARECVEIASWREMEMGAPLLLDVVRAKKSVVALENRRRVASGKLGPVHNLLSLQRK
jgi:hypothetical protein